MSTTGTITDRDGQDPEGAYMAPRYAAAEGHLAQGGRCAVGIAAATGRGPSPLPGGDRA